MAQENNKIDNTLLIARFSAMGDVAIAVPVVYALCRRYPRVKVIFVTRRPFDALFVDAPSNLTVLTADLKGAHKGLGGIMSFTRRIISEYHPAAFADLHDVLRTKAMRIVCRLSGIKTAHIDKGRAEKRMLTRQGAQIFGRQLKTSSERYADVLRKLGYDIAGSDTTVLRHTVPGINPPRIGIAPFAAHPGKAYPAEKMEQVVKELVRAGAHIWLFGAPGREQQTLDSWAADAPDSIISVPSLRLGLQEELRLMATLHVMVAMDSGNMHMASMAATPTVSVWGATHPFAGFTAPSATPELRAEVPLQCRPCSVFGNKPCRLTDTPYACLNNITPDMIVERVKRALAAGACSPDN